MCLAPKEPVQNEKSANKHTKPKHSAPSNNDTPSVVLYFVGAKMTAITVPAQLQTGIGTPIGTLVAPEAVTDVAVAPELETVMDVDGLAQLHEEAIGRAEFDDQGNGVLTHEDDPSFSFVVGKFKYEDDDALYPFVKLGDNGVPTLI